MKDHPILFSAPMIRRIQAKRKFVTRRESSSWLKVRKGDLLWVRESFYVTSGRANECGVGYMADHPTGKLSDGDGGYSFHPFSDDPELAGLQWNWAQMHSGVDRWLPSIHMPRWASRYTLYATADAYRERLQDITEEQAIAEGVEPWSLNPDQSLTTGERAGDIPYRSGFALLWDELHPNGPTWKDNIEVTVIPFGYEAAQ